MLFSIESATVSIATILPGWLIGYLVTDDGVVCEYRALPVVSIAAVGDSVEPVVMTPDGKTLLASTIPGRAFAVGPEDSFERLAAAHASSVGRVARASA